MNAPMNEATMNAAKVLNSDGMRSVHRTEYWVWRAMHSRCERPADESYRWYGARGIKVCDRWSSCKNFIEDMGLRPGPGYSIDRKDGNGHYEPSNCRWATDATQNRNLRSNVYVNGVHLKDACAAAGVSSGTISARVSRTGVTHAEAIAYYLNNKRLAPRGRSAKKSHPALGADAP